MVGMVYGAVTRESVRSLGKHQLMKRDAKRLEEGGVGGGWRWNGNCRQTAEICQAMNVWNRKMCYYWGTSYLVLWERRSLKFKIMSETGCRLNSLSRNSSTANFDLSSTSIMQWHVSRYNKSLNVTVPKNSQTTSPLHMPHTLYNKARPCA
jgi:hypothetical protein